MAPPLLIVAALLGRHAKCNGWQTRGPRSALLGLASLAGSVSSLASSAAPYDPPRFHPRGVARARAHAI
eukprot:6089855-Lingulodinium_polyedra.AAC.1